MGFSDRKFFQGEGFGITGPEESYIVFIDGTGNEHTLGAHGFFPEDGQVPWSFYEALTGGFSEPHNAEVLARDQAEYTVPTAYRMKITIEYEPLSREETQALLDRARKKKTEDR